jgi:hypothetical protein
MTKKQKRRISMTKEDVKNKVLKSERKGKLAFRIHSHNHSFNSFHIEGPRRNRPSTTVAEMPAVMRGRLLLAVLMLKRCMSPSCTLFLAEHLN